MKVGGKIAKSITPFRSRSNLELKAFVCFLFFFWWGNPMQNPCLLKKKCGSSIHMESHYRRQLRLSEGTSRITADAPGAFALWRGIWCFLIAIVTFVLSPSITSTYVIHPSIHHLSPSKMDGKFAKWVFPKIMVPPKSSHLFIGFGTMKFINHPFWGKKCYPPIFWLVQHPKSNHQLDGSDHI